MQHRLTEIIDELEKAYTEQGDVPLNSDLLDLAVIAFMLLKAREEYDNDNRDGTVSNDLHSPIAKYNQLLCPYPQS